ncbi:unnamed protein product, partial [Mycena citricolor]
MQIPALISDISAYLSGRHWRVFEDSQHAPVEERMREKTHADMLDQLAFRCEVRDDIRAHEEVSHRLRRVLHSLILPARSETYHQLFPIKDGAYVHEHIADDKLEIVVAQLSRRLVLLHGRGRTGRLTIVRRALSSGSRVGSGSRNDLWVNTRRRVSPLSWGSRGRSV